MSPGLNPAGTLCLGAINTIEVLIGNAIKIDNTTSEITINGEAYAYVSNGSQTVLPIISKEGLNPTGTLRIGTSNTSEIDMGLLKIDNTVVPPQVYINGIALPPGSLTNTGDKFTLDPGYDSRGNDYDTTPDVTIQDPIATYWNYSDTGAVQVKNYDATRRALSLVAPGIYDIWVNISIKKRTWTSPAKFYWTPRPNTQSNFTDKNNNLIPANSELPGSSIEFTFDAENSNTTFTGYKQFRVYTNSTDSEFILATDTLRGIVNRNGTDITIKRVGKWPPNI
jgi:hypothetical protein